MLDIICLCAILIGLFHGFHKLKISSTNNYPCSDNIVDFLIGKNVK